METNTEWLQNEETKQLAPNEQSKLRKITKEHGDKQCTRYSFQNTGYKNAQ